MQRLCLQPLHAGEHCSPPGSSCKGGALCSSQPFSQQQLGSRIKSWQLPASDQAAVLATGSVSAGGMQVMPSHPGPFQHLGCCRKVPGAHNALRSNWDLLASWQGGFHCFKSFFPLLWPFSPHCTSGNLKVVKRKKKSCFVLLLSMNPLLCDGTAL